VAGEVGRWREPDDSLREVVRAGRREEVTRVGGGPWGGTGGTTGEQREGGRPSAPSPVKEEMGRAEGARWDERRERM
jgi:hypothetical protein